MEQFNEDHQTLLIFCLITMFDLVSLYSGHLDIVDWLQRFWLEKLILLFLKSFM
jgi:hypothetical protein